MTSKTRIQSLLFSRISYTRTAALQWAKTHKFKSNKIHGTKTYWRLRQFDPTRGRKKRTITLDRGIRAIVEFVPVARRKRK